MTRHALFSTFAVLFAIAAAIYLAARQTRLTTPAAAAVVEAAHAIDTPLVMFRMLAPGPLHGRIGMIDLRAPDGARHVASLSCARVSYAAGRGLCLVEEADGTGVRHAALVFDRTFATGARIALDGIPTRARVSSDGRLGAITVYGEEHAPDGEERLATKTTIVELATGRIVTRLDGFTIEGLPLLGGPRDFAGVTFDRDPDRFYATLLTGGSHHVLAGSFRERRLRLVARDRASEALSPDGRRLVVKRRVGAHGFWQVIVLDVASAVERPLNQGQRSIDDQVEWLDEAHVVYHDAADGGTGVWMLAADGVTPPKLLIADAYSPAVPH